MRLDKFLQATGVFKRRAAAKEACAQGRIKVNQMVARAGKEVSPGQTIEIEAWEGRTRVEVLEVPSGNVSKSERARFIRIVE